jgi:hypothetical protein
MVAIGKNFRSCMVLNLSFDEVIIAAELIVFTLEFGILAFEASDTVSLPRNKKLLILQSLLRMV